eukprot:5638307-Amphidinium_carterae.1
MELRNIDVDVKSFTKLADRGVLCCHLAEDADAEKVKFLEFLPVKVDGSDVEISSVVMQCREHKHGDSIERELVCRLPSPPPL